MRGAIESLGIIAGSRSLPLVVAAQARAMGVRRLVAVGFDNETDPALSSLVDELVWVKVGQLSKLIEAFKRRGVRHCVMAGQVAPKNLFDVRPDLRGLLLLMKITERNAHTIFGAIADELLKEGVELIEATPWLAPCMPGPGFLIGKKLGKEEQADIAFGLQMAKEISRLEIGQTVVVKQGTVLAVEGFEGTDACLLRGGQLAGRKGGAVAVKVARENHDMRFDIPCIGLKTLEVCAEAGVAVLGFEGGKTLLLDGEELERVARQHRLTVVAV